MDDDADYVTVLPTTDPHKFLTCVMVYVKKEDAYVSGRCSGPLTHAAARALAQMWAAAKHLEVR